MLGDRRHAGVSVLVAPGDAPGVGTHGEGGDRGALLGLDALDPLARDVGGPDPAVIEAGQTRMRQIFMTALSACIGLVPAAFSTGIGSEVQKPLAVVIVAGMLVSPIFSLLMIPVLSRMFMPWVPGPTSGEEPPADAVPVAEPHAT